MARPRKQTYTLEMYLEKNKDGDISNDADTQRKPAWKAIINGLIVTVLTDDYIPPIILAEEDTSQLHIADGGSRTAALMMFRHGNYKITSSVEDSVILYKKKEKDEDENIIWKDENFDIKGKTYEQLPEELKKKFNEYQIETVIHEHCDKNKIAKYIKRYNEHSAMNTDQKAFTYIDKFANRIRKILESKFFLDCNVYSENDKTKGAIERIIVETMMCTNHFDKWNKQIKSVCKYLNDNATDEEFDVLANNLHRLENIITDDIRCIFDKKDSFIFLTLFNRFTKLGVEDIKFAEFLRAFKTNLRKTKRNINGFLFDEIKKNSSTKDKQVIIDKLDMLEKLMLDFLHINSKEQAEILNNRFVTSKDIIKEYVNNDVDDDEIELYEMMANDISEVIDDIDSEFLSDNNRPSFVALVGYADKLHNDKLLSDWLVHFEKKKDLISDQIQNFLHMKQDLDRFVINKEKKSA